MSYETWPASPVQANVHIRKLEDSSSAVDSLLALKVFSEIVTTVGGAASEDFTMTGVLATDVVIVTLHTEGSSAVSIVRAAAGVDKVTVEFSADPAADHLVNILVIRGTV